ncbi:hypothetical protein RA20_06770 [Leisingera sp. ANG-Vp]|nr:hypothetical protein RA20_06770 [Leisingera sp. ANG-Vp]
MLKHRVADEVYPGGLAALESFLDKKEEAFQNLGAVLPLATADLSVWRDRILPEQDSPHRDVLTADAKQKLENLRMIFAGKPDLFALHALVIAAIRRKKTPPRALKLFFRMWEEHGDFLARNLPPRWLISAAVTFADHGSSIDQRMAGQALAITFDMIKLHDSERRLAGVANDRAFTPSLTPHKYPLAFDLPPYVMAGGDLDISHIVKIWRQAKGDTVIRPLAERMLTLLLEDKRTVFARIQVYKDPSIRERRASM